ncbi:hypothetical protein A4G19_04915 [Pasteurellaceae bacterium Macca]|nr:hypothetical protein [Pasteurellaceae bacterium Macca]
MKYLLKAETLTSLLIALAIFAILIFNYGQWQNSQHQQMNRIYQQQQALLIAENQLTLKLAKLPCEKQQKQNHLLFKIECSPQQIKVIFPLGEITLGENS